MTDRIFGKEFEHEVCRARRAAYVVVRDGDLVAPVKRDSREVSEELACEITIDSEIGSAVQYFYSSDDQVYNRMNATFFTGRFSAEAGGEIFKNRQREVIANAG